MKNVLDSFTQSFASWEDMLEYHKKQSENSSWITTDVKNLHVCPLDTTSPLFTTRTLLDPTVPDASIEDTAENLGLAIKVSGAYVPLRDTAYKSLLDRAKIGGSVLPKLSKNRLSDILNACLSVHKKSQALLLVRDSKVAAVHSGDKRDYSVLPIDHLLSSFHKMLDDRFPGAAFENGYCDHSIVSATFNLSKQTDELLEAYQDSLKSLGHSALADSLTPAIRFQTSDVGVSSARVFAYLRSNKMAIAIGNAIAVDHRHEAKISNFQLEIRRVYAQYQNQISKLTKLTSIFLTYPINAMIAACKKLSLPKKAALEAIHMFEVSWGDDPGTAHDVFMALQEIPYLLKSDGFSTRKLFETEEKLAGAVSLKWNDFDTAKAVSY